MKKSLKPIIPTYEGVQLCIINSERLFSDSLEVSRPSRAALLELSLEEISKAWKMFFFLQAEEYEEEGEDKEPTYSFVKPYEEIEQSEEFQAFIDFMDENHQELYSLEIYNGDFSAHDRKLDYIGLIVSYLKVMLPLTKKILDLNELWRSMSSGILSLPKSSEINVVEDLGYAEEFIATIDEKYITGFTRLKETGFYVDYINDIFVYPSVDGILVNSLEFLVAILINGLKSSLRLLHDS